jgi:dGTPase
VLDRLASDLIEATRRALQQEGIADAEEVRRHPARLAGFSPAVAAENAALKRFLYAKLYDNASLVEERERSVEALEGLFRFYVQQPERMPPFYARQARDGQAHRVVCDYIAGMTDHFLLRLHGEITGSARGSQGRARDS